MKLFETPEIEVIRFKVENIMAESVTVCEDCEFDFGCENEI